MDTGQFQKTLQERLGSGFHITEDGWEVLVSVKQNNSLTPIAKIISDRQFILIQEEEGIRNAQGLTYVELRSQYRQVAEIIKEMEIGSVHFI